MMQRLLKYSQRLFQLDSLYISNVSATFLSQLFSALSVLVLTPRLYTNLGPEQFSVYGIILNAIVVGAILDFGMNLGLLRRLIKERVLASQLISSVMFAYFITFLMISVLSGAAFFISSTFYTVLPLSKVFILFILVFQTIVANLLDVVIQSSQKIFKAKVIRAVKILIETILILLFITKNNLSFILGIMLLMNALYIGALYINAKKLVLFNISFKLATVKLIKEHVGYSIWYFLTALSAVLVFNSQIFLLNQIVGAILLSQFLVFARFFEIIRLAVSNFTIVLFPKIVSIEGERTGKALLNLYIAAIKRVLLVLVGVGIVLYFFGGDLFLWWTKNKIEFDVKLYYLFLAFTILILLDNVSAIFLSALKLNKLPTIISLMQGILGLTLTYFLAHEYGLAGAIVASMIGLLTTSFIVNPFYLIKKLRERF
jgi:O-antigen/teichoic acid export membrane protein